MELWCSGMKMYKSKKEHEKRVEDLMIEINREQRKRVLRKGKKK